MCDKYGTDDKLYPNDLAVRATVNARLYFDIGTFYKAFGDCVVIIAAPYKNINNDNNYYYYYIYKSVFLGEN